MGRGRLRVVVAGGGTRAPIDDVRVITNRSTGRFSALLTEAWAEAGAEVWHLHAPEARLPFFQSSRFDLDAPDPKSEIERLTRLAARWAAVRDRIHLIDLSPGRVGDYESTLRNLLTGDAAGADLVMLPIAVSDYEPEPFHGKIDSTAETLTIRCHRTPKVIRSVKGWAPEAYLVGFKLVAERLDDERARQIGERACELNRADATVVNWVGDVGPGSHMLRLVRPGAAVVSIGPDPEMAAKALVQELAAELARTDRP